MNSPKAVIFDLGNVLLNWDVDLIINSLDLDLKESAMLREELFMHQDWLDMDHGLLTESIATSMICNRSALSEDSVARALLAAKTSLQPIAGTVSLMQDIARSGIAMYCLSNMSRETYEHIKEKDFFQMFKGIVISGIERCMKPGEEIFHLTLNRFSLVAVETLFIDDSIANVEAAQRLGINGFHFKRTTDCYLELERILF